MHLEILQEIMYYDGPVLFLAQDLAVEITDPWHFLWCEYVDDDEKEDRVFRAYPVKPFLIEGKVASLLFKASEITWKY